MELLPYQAATGTFYYGALAGESTASITVQTV
jgi:hypothetical protein